MVVGDLILRLRIEKDNKLFKRRVGSFLMVPKENVVEQVVKTTIKTTK